MQLPYKLLSLAYLTLSAIAAPALPTTAAEIKASLQLCYNIQVPPLQASLKSLSDPSGVPIVKTNLEIVSNGIKAIIPIAQSAPQLTLTEANSIFVLTHDNGLQLIKAVLEDIQIPQHAVFLKGLVGNLLRTLKNDIEDLLAALKAISPAPVKDQFDTDLRTINTYFNATFLVVV